MPEFSGEPQPSAEFSREKLPVSRRRPTDSPKVLRAREISTETIKSTANLEKDLEESGLLKK